MALVVPPAVNYQSPLVAVPTRWQNKNPAEGPKMIPCEIDWGQMGGPNNSVFFNLQNNATLNFSQITAIAVDNSACGGDVQFAFPDTTETVTIPAYSPKIIVPVFTNQTQFYVLGIGVQATDVTRFSIQNVVPPPIAVPVTEEQNTAVFNNITTQITAPGTLQLVPAGVNGTVETVFATVNAGGGILIFTLQDGSGKIIAGGQTTGVAGSSTFTVLDLQEIRVRFQNGLRFISSVATISAGGAASINVYYRTP